MSDPEPVFHYSRPGFEFTVWPNRIEVAEKGNVFNKKQHAILLRTINSVSVEGMTKKLKIVTNDGKKWEWQLGRDGEKARDAILPLL